MSPSKGEYCSASRLSHGKDGCCGVEGVANFRSHTPRGGQLRGEALKLEYGEFEASEARRARSGVTVSALLHARPERRDELLVLLPCSLQADCTRICSSFARNCESGKTSSSNDFIVQEVESACSEEVLLDSIGPC
jgi:hypothetical protein